MTSKAATPVKWTLFILIAGLFVLPAIQKVFHPVHSRALEGYIEPNPFPEFSLNSLFEGLFLPRLTKHYNRSVGFHNELVRLHNQVDFSLFRIPNARSVVIGKEDYLFEDQYINAFNGRDFIGVKKIEARVRQIRFAQDRLWKEKGILFLVLILPDKGTFYPEYIPQRFKLSVRENTNYKWYSRKLKEEHVNLIDYSAWFRAMKDTSGYPLFSKSGIHWSSYGSYLAMDSLVRYLEEKTGRAFSHARVTQTIISRNPMDRDDDVERALNLAWGIPSQPLAYPKVTWKKPGNQLPFSALFIGDSFYFTWAEAGYIGNVFRNRDFWYFDHDVYYGTYPTGERAVSQDLKRMLSQHDAIIFLQTSAGYGQLGYFFIDRLLAAGGL